MKNSLNHVLYFQRMISEIVHLRGIEKYTDLKPEERDQLNDEFAQFLGTLIKEESRIQYGENHETRV